MAYCASRRVDAPIFPARAPLTGNCCATGTEIPMRKTLRSDSQCRARNKFEPSERKAFCRALRLFEVLDQQAMSDRAVTFSPFSRSARTGIPSAEGRNAHRVHHEAPGAPGAQRRSDLAVLREILVRTIPASRCVPCSGRVLTEILPEFSRIDSLVVRDFYHRYTVDEHSLRTIEHLQELADPPDERGCISNRCGRPWSAHLLILSCYCTTSARG